MKRKYNIGVTIGDVNGIGLEIFAKFLNSKFFEKIEEKVKFLLFGKENIIFEYLKMLQNAKSLLMSFENSLKNGSVEISEVEGETNISFGKISKESGKFSLNSLNAALNAYLAKKIDCLVTLPICKEAVQMNEPNFVGHTEYIAKYLGEGNPLMTFIFKDVRMCLLTTHIPLSEVSKSIQKEIVIEKTKIFVQILKEDFHIPNPKVAILGLNPHSGENGAIGYEEVQVIKPAIEFLRSQGLNISGPFPSDGFFAFMQYRNFDGVVANYHDQGLIAFKILSKGEGVNFTANLPLVRTSPDHGTSFDISGKNIADYKSLKNAIYLALQIAKARQNSKRKFK